MIKFVEGSHTYTKGEDKYVSVTSLLHKLEVKKDWNKIAEKYAKKNKKNVDEVKAEWKAENIKSTIRGSAYHLIKEKELLECEDYHLPIFPSPLVEGIKISRDMRLEEGIYPELLIFLDSAKIAGQADIVEVANGFISVKDYKTSKKIDIKGFVNWEGKEAKLLYPVSHLPECNFSLYSLQVNLYMYILLRHNPKLKIGNMELLHAKFDEQDNYLETIVYKIPDLQKETKVIVDLYKQGKI